MQKKVRRKINTRNNEAKRKRDRNETLFKIRKLCKKAYEKCLIEQVKLMEKPKDDK